MRELRAKILLFACYIRYLKIKSAANLCLLRLSYYASVIMRKPVLLRAPSYYSIEPVNFCNLACPECPTGNGTMQRRAQRIDFAQASAFVHSVANVALHINFYFQGEPFLYPQLNLLVKIADDRRIVTAVSTNGHFITAQAAEEIVRSGLKKLIVSLDGYSQESYSRYRRNGDYETVLASIRALHDAKRRLKSSYPVVCAQVLLLSSTEDHLPDIQQIAYHAGADSVEFKTAQFYEPATRSELMPVHSPSRYQRDGGGYIHSGKAHNWCWRAWSNPVICADGKMVPCCYDKNAEHAFGNIFSGTAFKAFTSEERRDFMQTILLRRQSMEMCSNCPEGRSIFP